jgi:hypothetical protein
MLRWLGYLVRKLIKYILIYLFRSGLIMMCALCVPGSMIHGSLGIEGLVGSPVDSGVANGI